MEFHDQQNDLTTADYSWESLFLGPLLQDYSTGLPDRAIAADTSTHNLLPWGDDGQLVTWGPGFSTAPQVTFATDANEVGVPPDM
jgi:hypothetical protein